MKSQNENQLRRIERSSTFFRGCCTVILVVVAIATVVAVVAAASGRLTAINFAGQTLPIPDLPARMRAFVAAAVLITGAAAIKALYHLRRLLDNYTRREIFTSSSARQIRAFGISCVLWGAVKVMWGLLVAAVGSHHAAVSVDAAGDAFVIGLVIIVISRFTEMAVALREENDLTI